ncbi:MAG: hypothetical protein ACE5IM_08290, partial [Nitrospinota bacterium]
PPGRLDPGRIVRTVNGLKPKGKTPLSEAVRQAARRLRYQEEKATVVLVSDGKETCGADPCALGRELEKGGVDFTAHVIGFDLKEEERKGLRCLAENTGGLFLEAGDAQTLANAMGTAVQEASLPRQKDTIVIPVLKEGGPRTQVSLQWTAYQADAAGKRGKRVASVPDYTFHRPLPTGRYLIEVKYRYLTARKAIEVDANAPARHELSLNAGVARLVALMKAGGERYKGVGLLPNPVWAAHPVRTGGEPRKNSLVTDYRNPQRFLLPPGRFLVKFRAGALRAEAPIEIRAGETTEKTLILDAGIARLKALMKAGGGRYKGRGPLPYLQWKVFPLGADGKPAGKELGTSLGKNPGVFALPAGRYLARAKAGAASGETPLEIRPGGTTEISAALDAGIVRLIYVGGDGKPLRGKVQAYIHPVGRGGAPAKSYVTYGFRNRKPYLLGGGRYLVRGRYKEAKFEAGFEVGAGERKDVEIRVKVP